ncbi:MAG: hypothetical protein JNK95_03035 [Candidatus Competibacter sp.]|nr:hypothetical protein [Candidatus Competibacter sp.]MDG4606312.1 hypothetical protein [Candidatus Contendobacter sp.]HRD49153.1 hypothetical protein [Candidatus Contendobacter sp.]
MRAITRDLLTREAVDWHQQGLIDHSLLDDLLARYESRGRFLAALLKWLGLFAIFQLGLSVLAFIALASESALVAAILLSGISVGLWIFGVRLATHPRQLHPFTGSVLVTASLAAAFGVFILLNMALGGGIEGQTIPMILLLTGVLATLTAYRYHLRWPLLLALLLFFHGLGAWHAYGGHGAYFADIQEPRIMAVVALAAIALGVWHERHLENRSLRRCSGFGALILIFGLLYLNLSLWFLTLPGGSLDWVLVFTAAGLGQMVAGARLHDARFTGFGIVFFSINLYTRYFEHFWDQLSLAAFFLIGGALAMAFGYACEHWSLFRASEKPR